jgi:adenylate cyclase
MGDGIMATFGAAVTSPTYAADALKTIDDIMIAAAAWGEELRQEGKPLLKMGAAVATGKIIFGAVGDESRMEYTVIGDAVNLSAKLEKHTKSEGVRALCTASAFDIAARQGYHPAPTIEQRKSRNIEGVAHPIDIIVLAP